jgi:hypothetical protein
MRAACASILGKTDTAVREELAGFNLTDRSLNQQAKLSALIFVDSRL